MDGRRQLNGRVPVTVANGGFGRTGGGTVSRAGAGRHVSSVRADNSGTGGAAGSGPDIGSSITRSGTHNVPTTETLVRRRREIVSVLRSGRIFA